MTLAVLVIATIAAGAAGAAPAAASASACDLLAPEEIRAVQKTPLKDRKPSEHQSQGLRFAQCVFTTSDFVRSVSLSVITGSGGQGARGYWDKTFHSKAAKAARKKPPLPVPGDWDEAFWSSEARAGALYVLSNAVVLRVSVGGVADDDERLRRTKSLVEAALRRLRATR
jgi:hypothetical protein